MSQPHSPEARPRHESADVRTRPLLQLALAFVVLAALLLGLLWLLLQSFTRAEAALDPLPSAARARVGQTVPPEPRLQVNPSLDAEALQRADQEKLSRYAWVDRERGVVAIPIERAMDLIVQRSVSGAAKP